MSISEDGIPNKSLQATPVGAGFVVLSRRPGVPELGRYTKAYASYRKERKEHKEGALSTKRQNFTWARFALEARWDPLRFLRSLR